MRFTLDIQFFASKKVYLPQRTDVIPQVEDLVPRRQMVNSQTVVLLSIVKEELRFSLVRTLSVVVMIHCLLQQQVLSSMSV